MKNFILGFIGFVLIALFLVALGSIALGIWMLTSLPMKLILAGAYVLFLFSLFLRVLEKLAGV